MGIRIRQARLASNDQSAGLVQLDKALSIGALAQITGVNAKAIRHYESIGLLPRPQRQANGYRRYSLADVNRLRLLRRIRLLGVSLTATKPLLIDASDARCADVRQELLSLMDQRLAAIDQEIVELRAFRAEVEDYQRALIACQPDEEMRFSVCDDLACMLPDEHCVDEYCTQEKEDAVPGAL